MNKYRLLLLVVVLIFYFSCSSEEIVANDTGIIDSFNIENYHGIYVQYNVSISLNTNSDNLVKFEYDEDNRITKRIGDIVYTSLGGGYLHDSLYTELVYNNNKVSIQKKIAPFGGISEIEGNESTITFDDNNRMIQKVTFKENDNPQVDTTHYTYANDKLISYLKTSNRTSQGSNWEFRNFEQSNLYYTNDNLDSIVTVYSYKPNFEDYTVLQRKETKFFSSYDTAQNPFIKLKIFDETFSRSLSKNNFTEYKITSNYYNYPNNNYSLTPTISATQEDYYQEWSFAYDDNGEWIYNQF